MRVSNVRDVAIPITEPGEWEIRLVIRTLKTDEKVHIGKVKRTIRIIQWPRWWEFWKREIVQVTEEPVSLETHEVRGHILKLR